MEPDGLLCSRNARPQKDGGERLGALFARRAPTMKQWSLDARSKGQAIQPSLAHLLRF